MSICDPCLGTHFVSECESPETCECCGGRTVEVPDDG